MKTLLDVRNISKRFGGLHAVENFSFAIEKNTIIGLIGPNGAGKTTAFNLITHFLPRNEGSIFFQEKNLKKKPPYALIRHGIARTFQQIRIFPELTVRENVLLSLSWKYDSWWKSFLLQDESEENATAYKLLSEVHLEKHRDEKAGNLSYGQSKLLEMVRTIATGAELILFDEPAAGVNPPMLNTVKKLIRNLKAQGKTIFIIEHNMPFLMEMAEEIIVMENGKFLCRDVPTKIQKDIRVLEAYLGGS